MDSAHPEPLRRAERIALAASAAAGLWLVLTLPVFAQEAYYWCYAQHPDLSYFDHPPMVAWLIAVGTAAFGDGALGIRAGAWACGVAATVAGTALLRAFGVGAAGRIAWIVACIGVPAFAATRFLANPDPPLVLGWTVCVLALWRAREGRLGWWIAAGCAAGFALLGKYTAGFLAVGGVAVLALDPAMRRQLRSAGPYVGVATAVLVFSPVLVWNVQHDFASFRFQTASRYEHAVFDLGNFGESIVQQIGVLHPAIALLLPVWLVWLGRAARRGDRRALWLVAFGVPLPVYLLAHAPWMGAKVNWFTPAYVALVAGAVVWWSESGWPALHPRLARAARASMAVVWLVLPLAPFLVLVPSGHGSSWTGWEEIAARAAERAVALDAADGRDGGVFLFGSDYKDAAQLAHGLALFEGSAAGAPRLGPVLAQNVHGAPALQFDLWTAPETRVGDDAVLVVSRPERRAPAALARIRPVFESVERTDEIRVERFGRVVFTADLYVCRGYAGPGGG